MSPINNVRGFENVETAKPAHRPISNQPCSLPSLPFPSSLASPIPPSYHVFRACNAHVPTKLPLLICFIALGFSSPFLTIGTFAFEACFSSVESMRESIFSGRWMVWRAAEREAMERPRPRPKGVGRRSGRRNIEAMIEDGN